MFTESAIKLNNNYHILLWSRAPLESHALRRHFQSVYFSPHSYCLLTLSNIPYSLRCYRYRNSYDSYWFIRAFGLPHSGQCTVFTSCEQYTLHIHTLTPGNLNPEKVLGNATSRFKWFIQSSVSCIRIRSFFRTDKTNRVFPNRIRFILIWWKNEIILMAKYISWTNFHSFSRKVTETCNE